jgi:membrane protease YdiL (CAAX protease family)
MSAGFSLNHKKEQRTVPFPKDSRMKNTLLSIAGLTLAAAVAEAIILARIHLDPWRLAALLESLALLLGVFVAFTYTAFIHQLRRWAHASLLLAILMPCALLIPYLILAFSTNTFSYLALGKLAAYIAVPTLLLLPNRRYHVEGASWRDFAAMISLGLPVSAGWLSGIWIWPEDIYIFRPIFCVCVGAYAFFVIRDLKDAGYKLLFKKGDLTEGTINFIAFIILAIPLGLALHFIHPHAHDIGVFTFITEFVGIYLTVAIPEEFLFRGVLQNLLVKTFKGPRHRQWGLFVASVIFGLSHLHHAPVPNWRYAVMATLAGIFYGNAWRVQKRTSSSAFTHALVDTVWRFWF